VEEPDLDRAVPGAEKEEAQPSSIAACGCSGHEEPANSEAGQTSRSPDRLRRSPAYSRAETSQDMPAEREEMLSTSGMSAGASEVAAMQEGSRLSERLQGREPRYSHDADSGTEDGRQDGRPPQ
jgi:hypothetical protein